MLLTGLVNLVLNDNFSWLTNEIMFLDSRLNSFEIEYQLDQSQKGRLGLAFVTISFLCLLEGTKLFIPHHLKQNGEDLKQEKIIRQQTIWKRSNMLISAFSISIFFIAIIEFSYWE